MLSIGFAHTNATNIKISPINLIYFPFTYKPSKYASSYILSNFDIE